MQVDHWRLWEKWLLFALGVICLLLAFYFIYQNITHIRHQPPPFGHRSDVSLIQDWMTIPYISGVYGVPEQVIFDSLGLDRNQFKKARINQIAQKQGKSSGEILQTIRLTITNFQTNSSHNVLPPPKLNQP